MELLLLIFRSINDLYKILAILLMIIPFSRIKHPSKQISNFKCSAQQNKRFKVICTEKHKNCSNGSQFLKGLKSEILSKRDILKRALWIN